MNTTHTITRHELQAAIDAGTVTVVETLGPLYWGSAIIRPKSNA